MILYFVVQTSTSAQAVGSMHASKSVLTQSGPTHVRAIPATLFNLVAVEFAIVRMIDLRLWRVFCGVRLSL